MTRPLLTLLLCASTAYSFALVKYDEGRRIIDGIVLLQDSEQPSDYYYLVDAPRLAQREDGSFELMCLKYVGTGGPETNGGLFHALIEFSLEPERVAEMQRKLQEVVPGARIAGPVPMLENIRDGEAGMAGFRVVSSILSDTEGELPLTKSIVDSGHCPLLPGSRAAIAARLSQEGATLLWSSFQGSTSDVSVSINGYYEALVRGYNAIVEAEASTVYEHFSLVFQQQSGYDREHLRDATNQLIQDQTIRVEVFDRSEGLDIETDDMQAIVDLVTNKLIEVMFDAKAGWAKAPPTEATLDQDQLRGRQERGAFAQFFAGSGDQEYVTDNQFVMKDIKDIRSNKVYLNLSKSTTIKVPFFSTGNIRGLYDIFGENSPYFRVINLDEPDFGRREVLFQVDGSFSSAFSEILNFVTVSFRKTYANGQATVTKEVVITGKDLKEGKDLQMIVYPALGLTGDQLLDYDYRLSWSFNGESSTVNRPRDPEQWLHGQLGAISLKPPFAKSLVEIDADLEGFTAQGMQAATVVFFTVLNGKPQIQKRVVFRAADAENRQRLALYHDEGEVVAYQISWKPADGSDGRTTPIRELSDNYLYIAPPQE